MRSWPTSVLRRATSRSSTTASRSVRRRARTWRGEPIALTVSNVAWLSIERKGLRPFVQAARLAPEIPFVLVGASGWIARSASSGSSAERTSSTRAASPTTSLAALVPPSVGLRPGVAARGVRPRRRRGDARRLHPRRDGGGRAAGGGRATRRPRGEAGSRGDRRRRSQCCSTRGPEERSRVRDPDSRALPARGPPRRPLRGRRAATPLSRGRARSRSASLTSTSGRTCSSSPASRATSSARRKLSRAFSGATPCFRRLSPVTRSF